MVLDSFSLSSLEKTASVSIISLSRDTPRCTLRISSIISGSSESDALASRYCVLESVVSVLLLRGVGFFESSCYFLEVGVCFSGISAS